MITEKRLIDPAPLIDYFSGGDEVKSMAESAWDEAFVTALKNAPTVDAAVHGRWIFKHDLINDPKGYFIRIVCSECNLHTGQKSNYCPNCGAKMDGGGTDDN